MTVVNSCEESRPSRNTRPVSSVGILFGVIALYLMSTSAAMAAEPPRVMVTVKAIHSLVAGLMEGVAQPELIASEDISFGAEGHGQPSDLARADLVIWLGQGAEPKLAAALQKAGAVDRSLPLLSMEAIKVLPTRIGGNRVDPFIWLDTRNMLILLDEISRELAAIDPIRAHRYETNRLEVLKRLALLDRSLEYGYRQVSAVPVFTYHDTHQYFEQAYAMKVAAIAAVGGEAATAEDLLQMRELLTEAPNPCILTESSLPEPHLDLVLMGIDARIVEIDSFGTNLPAGPGMYERMMREQFDRISECVSAASPETAPARLLPPIKTPQAPELYGHRIDGKYLLMNQFGETVSNLDFAGSYQLIYFGYTYCPDICPTSLAIMKQAMNLLGPKAERIQPLFISVDPERDTLEAIRKYTGYFHPRLIGLTGPPEMIARTADKFHVKFEKVPVTDGGDPSSYAVDHTSALFLLGPNSEFVAKFAHGFPARDLAVRLDELIEE